MDMSCLFFLPVAVGARDELEPTGVRAPGEGPVNSSSSSSLRLFSSSLRLLSSSSALSSFICLEDRSCIEVGIFFFFEIWRMHVILMAT